MASMRLTVAALVLAFFAAQTLIDARPSVASWNPSGTFDKATKVAHKATGEYIAAAFSFLPQQNIGGCNNLTAGVVLAAEAAELAVQLAAAAGTKGSAKMAMAAQVSASITPLCGGTATLGISCAKQSCNKEIAKSKSLLKKAQATATKARLLGALTANTQGANAMRVAKSIAPEFSSSYSVGPIAFPAATAAAAAAQFFNRAVQWLVQAGACKEAKTTASSAADAATIAGNLLANADTKEENLYSNINDAASFAIKSSKAASAADSLCTNNTAYTQFVLLG